MRLNPSNITESVKRIAWHTVSSNQFSTLFIKYKKIEEKYLRKAISEAGSSDPACLARDKESLEIKNTHNLFWQFDVASLYFWQFSALSRKKTEKTLNLHAISWYSAYLALGSVLAKN